MFNIVPDTQEGLRVGKHSLTLISKYINYFFSILPFKTTKTQNMMSDELDSW